MQQSIVKTEYGCYTGKKTVLLHFMTSTLSFIVAVLSPPKIAVQLAWEIKMKLCIFSVIVEILTMVIK